jgi:hypothetical protein
LKNRVLGGKPNPFLFAHKKMNRFVIDPGYDYEVEEYEESLYPTDLLPTGYWDKKITIDNLNLLVTIDDFSTKIIYSLKPDLVASYSVENKDVMSLYRMPGFYWVRVDNHKEMFHDFSTKLIQLGFKHFHIVQMEQVSPDNVDTFTMFSTLKNAKMSSTFNTCTGFGASLMTLVCTLIM